MRQPTTNLSAPFHQQIQTLSEVQRLMERVDSYARLGRKLTAKLDLPLQKNVEFSCIDGKSLRFLANSSAWAMKLRLMSDGLIALANDLGHQVKTLKITVKRIE